MKRKILSVLFALVLVLTFSLVTAVPVAAYASPAPVALGAAGNFVILAKSGITTTGTTSIVGDIGVSPITYAAITGFSLTPATPDGSNTFSTSALVTGKVYAADYTEPTPTNLGIAVLNMEAAYTDAAGRAADATGLGAGNIGGLTITPGVYKWTTGVTIPTDVTLSGGPNDVWIFQIAGTLDISSAKKVILSGDAQAKKIFWAVAGAVSLGTTSEFNGNILAQTNIAMNTGATLNGRALAQTAVTLIANTITLPAAAPTTYYVTTTGSDASTTGNATAPFLTIQHAIDAASANDTINVAAGTYNENVNVNKRLTLQGAGSTTVNVTAANPAIGVFTVTASNVNISGFTATGALKTPLGLDDYAGIYFPAHVENCNIHDNTLTGNQYGILLLDTENSATTGNNTFTSNIASSNNVSGIEMQHSYGNTFTSNIANSNTKYGFKLDGVSHNMFTGNTANSNTVSGFYLVKGESTSGCLYNTFTNNTANSNTEYGLREDNGAHNTLTGNTFNANVVAGLRLKEVITYLTLNNNSISGSPIGIDIATSATTVTTWIVKYNNIAGTVYGVSNAGTGTLDARYNYWGTAAGPYHATTNPGVTGKRGATVTNSVTYAPWLFLTTTANGGNTVANIVANEVPAYAQSVVLSSGWNTFSVPIALDGQYNAWGELYTLTSLPYTVAYRFNPTTQQFDSLATDSTFALAPGEAVYVKLTADNSIPYCYSTPFSIPSRALSAGWNLIGGGLTVKTEVDTCISIATSGSTAGYTHIISPAENAQAWIYIAGAATAKNIALGEGYWVFLPIARTLGLFDLTPVTWVP